VTITHAEATDVLNVYGGEGNDIISASTLPASAMQLVLNGGNGNDVITGNAAANTLHGDAGKDTLNGGGGAEVLGGDADNDRLVGGDGNDTLAGGAGDDVLLGELGDDMFVGGLGNDTITTGAGNDVIMYSDVSVGHDTVLDFDGDATGGQDRVNLDELLDFLGLGAEREFRVFITDHGDTVDVAVDTDGKNGADLTVATLHTSDEITLKIDVIIG
jgi:Ca2+-binding RTX toxin-like protein